MKGFFIWFVIGSFFTFTGIGLVNWWFNPYGEYSHDGFWSQVEHVQSIDGRGRSAKVILMHRLASPPQVLILGNSRSVALPAQTITDETGLTAFNAATVNGTMYDLLAFTRYALAQPNQQLQTIILGLDPLMFADIPPDAELLRYPLVKYLPEINRIPLQMELTRIIRTASLDTLIASFRYAYWNVWLSSYPIYNYSVLTLYQPDGSLYHPQLDPVAEAGNFAGPYPDRIEYIKYNYNQNFKRDLFNDDMAGLFEEWLTLTEENNLCVLIFQPPYASVLLDYFEGETDYPAHRKVFDDYLQSLDEQYSFHFYDLERVDTFAGDERWFVDGVHTLSPNAEKIIQTLIQTGSC